LKKTGEVNTSISSSSPLNSYSFILIQSPKNKKSKNFERNWLHRFNTQDKQTYLVEANQHEYDVFVVKFSRKSDRFSKNKYGILTNRHDARRILATIIAISKDIQDRIPSASFVFLGEPTIQEKSDRVEEEERMLTKRFRIYRTIAEALFSPDNWSHIRYDQISGYILLNRKKADSEEGIEGRIIKMLKDQYEDLDNVELS